MSQKDIDDFLLDNDSEEMKEAAPVAEEEPGDENAASSDEDDDDLQRLSSHQPISLGKLIQSDLLVQPQMSRTSSQNEYFRSNTAGATEESMESLLPPKQSISKKSSSSSVKSLQKGKAKKKKKKESKAEKFAPKVKNKYKDYAGGGKNKPPLKEIEEKSTESEKEKEWPPPQQPNSVSPQKK